MSSQRKIRVNDEWVSVEKKPEPKLIFPERLNYISISCPVGSSNESPGEWITLSESSLESNWIEIFVASTVGLNNQNSGMLLDFLIEEDDTPVRMLENIQVGWLNGSLPSPTEATSFPLNVKLGQKIKVRVTPAPASTRSITNIGLGFKQFLLRDINIENATTIAYSKDGPYAGVPLIDSGSNNEMGPWVEIIEETPYKIQALGLFIGAQNRTDIVGQSEINFQVGLGSEGSETIILEDIPVTFDSNERFTYLYDSGRLFPVDIPEESRIAVRFMRQHSTNAFWDVGLLVVPKTSISQGRFLNYYAEEF